MFFVGENSRFAELLAAMGELSILSSGLPGEGGQTSLRSTRPITGRLTNFSPQFRPVLRIRIRRIHMFLGLTDPDLLVRDTDPAPDPDPSIIKQK
jgi:hypothetical protein